MLANNLRQLRKKNKLTQAEFADLFNIDRSTVSKWERDEYKPNLETLTEIAKFFNTTVDELTGIKRPNDEELIRFINHYKNNSILSKKSITILLVPIMNIALLLSIIISLLAVLVPTYMFNNNQDNDGKLVYSNIESVSMKLFVPNELPITINFLKSNNPFNPKYYINDLNVIVYDNPAFLDNLYTKVSIIVEFKNEKAIDLGRSKQLLLIDNCDYLHVFGDMFYLYFEKSGIYYIEFYIEEEMGYIGAYLSS